MRTIIKILVPVLIIFAAFGVYKWQMANKPEPKKRVKKKIIPIVQTIPAKSVSDYVYQVAGYGKVETAGSVTIVSETAGKVIWVNDKLKKGGIFKKNEWLYRIDDADYVSALDSAVASLKNAEYELQKIQEEADISKKEWEIWNEMSDVKKPASPLVNYEPQLASARATVKSAESAVMVAKSDLAKVVYKAPFACIVTEETVDHGKIIRAGESAGTLVRTDRYEIYLPMAAKDSVKINFSEDMEEASKGYVELTEGTESWKWDVYTERVLPSADSATGMLQAVLVVDDPFDTKGGERPVMPIGANVRASLDSGEMSDAIRIPEHALREGGVVWVVSQGKLQIREVSLLEKRGEYAYLSGGIIEGEKVIISDMEGVLDGMPVNLGGQKPKGKSVMGKGMSGGVK